jgi:hypothetical protein
MRSFLLLLLLLLSPAIVAGESLSLSQDFIDYVRVCENGIKKGWDVRSQRWFPYDDGTGWHVAYGHKIKKGENFSSGITEAEAQELLRSDLKEAYEKARIYYKARGYSIENFSPRQVEIVLDFVFNGCLHSHPKMMKAVAENDIEGQVQEYKRFAVLRGKRTELRDRNARFFARYLQGV